MKKSTAMVIAGIVSMFMLAGCGGQAQPAAPAAPAEPAQAAAPAEPAVEDYPEGDEEYYDEELYADDEEYFEDEDYEEFAEEGEAAYAEEGDEGEGSFIADGEYVTDETYSGELSADGKTMTITTALSEFVNSPSPTYEKQTYVINVADSCKCVQVQEDTTETSFFESMDLINDFLTGKSGLPITLTFKNNELVEILFSS